MILPISCQWLFLCSTCLDSEPLHFALESVEFFHASLYRWCLKNKLTLDLSRYIWKRLLGDNRCCNFFFFANCSTIVPEILKMYNLWWNSLKLGRNDQITHCWWKTLFGVLKSRYKVCFSLAMILPISCQWLFLCPTYLCIEPLHFTSESVEFFHASLYR